MIQKVLKVGSSAAVTVPKNSLEELGLKIGDRISLEIDKKKGGIFIAPIGKKVSKELLDWTNTFIERYRGALEALAKK